MRKSILIFLFAISLATTNVAQSNGFGIGIIVGEPTGISLKSWNSQTTALNVGIGWSFGRKGFLHVHTDYITHDFSLITPPDGKLPFYYGIGGRILLDKDSRIGVRGVCGLDYMFDTIPVDIFVEVVPIFDLIPSTDFSFNAGIGFRYFL